MTQPRTALTAPINPVTPRSELVDALAVAALGGILIGMSRRNSRAGTLARVAGLAMIGVAARPFISAAVRRAGARRRSVAVTTSIEIERPVAEVFAFFKDFENFRASSAPFDRCSTTRMAARTGSCTRRRAPSSNGMRSSRSTFRTASSPGRASFAASWIARGLFDLRRCLRRARASISRSRIAQFRRR